AARSASAEDAGAWQAPRSVVLKVMSINVRHNADFWEERFPLIADEIVRLAPDLIGFQEMQIDINQSKTLLSLIAERAGPDGVQYERYDHLKTGKEMLWGEGVTIFSRFPIEKKAYTDLEHGRPVILTRVKVNDDLSVDFYNTHLHHQGGDDVRLAQARKLADFAANNDAGLFTFLTGDMNSSDDTGTISYYLAHSFIDSYKALHGEDETKSIGNTSPVVISKSNTVQNFRNRIDYVFVKPPQSAEDKIKILDSVVCFKNSDSRGLYPSDHLGVMTTFEIQY
ncbi:MAG TPA: endonuclease/exonuclease/phosphatase family protein, partial [bacterium]|nr:endonuclease/exonuclease/phosphatase family protein [bacterium]